MKQWSLGLDLPTKKTRKRESLEEMERAGPWAERVLWVEPHHPRSRTGRPLFPIETMRRIRFMQQWFGLSDPAMGQTSFDVPMCRALGQLPHGAVRSPDQSTILRFRQLRDKQDLAAQILAAVHATLGTKGLMSRAGSDTSRHATAGWPKTRHR